MLHWAARNDYQRMAALLILNGVDLEAKDEVLVFLVDGYVSSGALLLFLVGLHSISHCCRIWVG